MGISKAAELNGVPEPAHSLEMKTQIGLSPEQIGQIEILFQEMQQQAISLGIKLIEYERELNTLIAKGRVTEELRRGLLYEIAEVQEQVCYVHLSTHLKTPDILTVKQIDLNNELRG